MKVFASVAVAAVALVAVVAGGAISQPAREGASAGANVAAQQPAPGRGGGGAAAGRALFQERCASCHDPAVDRAPNLSELSNFWADQVVAALKTGAMAPMADGMTDQQIRDVATFISGRAPGVTFDTTREAANRCTAGNRFNAQGPSWNGWSPDAQNMRAASNSAVTAQNVGRLKVKWAFAYQGGRYGQPTVVGNRVFVTSSSGMAYALDRETGCVAWSFSAAPAGIRVTVSVAPSRAAPSGFVAMFGDYGRNIYALDANSGAKLWQLNIESHPRAVLTGAPVAHAGTLYVPVSSWEETIANAAAYQCCTFRGSVVAIDIATGRQKWKSYTIPAAPAPFKVNSAGVQMFGPAGAAIWSPPTIDPKRNLLYVATGDSYTDVKEGGSDAIIAMDLRDGRIRWTQQVTKDDNFLTGCGARGGPPNCPETLGPDHDFGAAPILARLPNGKELVFSGQKSGQVYAMDPDDGGKIVWQTRIGRGSALGGVEWGIAADRNNLYVAVADRGMPTLTALRLTDGAQIWQHRAPEPAKCSFQGRCGNGYSGPPSLANGVLYGVNQDGHVRAFDARDGRQLWDYDTAGRTYATVNGVANQRGGNLDATGIVFAGQMAFLMVGYNGASGSSGPDNVLLAFKLE